MQRLFAPVMYTWIQGWFYYPCTVPAPVQYSIPGYKDGFIILVQSLLLYSIVYLDTRMV